MTHVPDDRVRPLCIFSVFYRVLSSCWARRASTCAWLSKNAPDYMFGGIPAREAPAAVMALQAAFDVDEAALLTMAFAKCFDHVLPQMAIENLRQVGCPAPFVAALMGVAGAGAMVADWKISVADSCARHYKCAAGMPGTAPMALTVLLIAAAQRVQRCTEGPLQQSIFVDDRAAVVTTVEDAKKVSHTWAALSRYLGLQENWDKFRIVARRMTQKLQSAGFEVSEQAVVLGTNFRSENRVDKLSAEFLDGEPLRLVQRLAKLPVRPSARELLYRTRIVSKMMWGTWYADWDLSDTNKFVTRVRRAAGVVQMGARALWFLLAGHWHDLSFQTQYEAVMTWLRAAHYWRGRQASLLSGPWHRTVQSIMNAWGFHEVQPHHWQHAVHGFVQWFAGSQKDDTAKTGHLLREAWRTKMVDDFLHLPRRESEELRALNAGYQANQATQHPVPQRVSGATRSTPRRRLERGRVCGDERSETPSCPVYPTSMWHMWSAGCSVLGARFVVLRWL